MDIALVGIGKIALDQHVPAIEKSPDYDLAATVSRQGHVPGIDAFHDFDAFLEARPDVRVVSLCVPPAPRFDYAAKAIAAGRHVMLEKPPGATVAECEKLAAMAEAYRVTLLASWHSREAAMVSPAQAWLNNKDIRRVRVTWHEDVRHWHPGQQWIWEPGGVGVFDPGINALSILTKILPERLHLTSSVLKFPENRHAPIAADLRFAYPGGAEVSANFDWQPDGPQLWQIEVETDQGDLVLTDGGGRMTLNGVEQGLEEGTLYGEYPRLYARLAALIATGVSDADFEPFRQVADAFLLARRETVAPFHD